MELVIITVKPKPWLSKCYRKETYCYIGHTQPSDCNGVWTRILTYLSYRNLIFRFFHWNQRAITGIKEHSKLIKVLENMWCMWKPIEISKKYDMNIKVSMGPAVTWTDQQQYHSSALSNILQVEMYVEIGGNNFFT